MRWRFACEKDTGRGLHEYSTHILVIVVGQRVLSGIVNFDASNGARR